MEIRKTFCDCTVFYQEEGKKAVDIFDEFFQERTGQRLRTVSDRAAADILFSFDGGLPDADAFRIDCTDRSICFSARSTRAFIYAVGLFFRKTVPVEEGLTLIDDISGVYSPRMAIRGHQLGYRTTPNTYDAWDLKQYDRYCTELMFFGMNTVEHIPTQGDDKINALMQYRPEDFCVEASKHARELGLDVSLWYPNSETTDEEAERNRERLFAKIPYIDAVFPPGGDPGDMDAPDFIRRVKTISHVLKKRHPNAEMWPSAQKPHEFPHWGERFLQEMSELPEEIDGVVIGPNRAMDIDELRRALPARYPIRFYPDITHNVRCEYPVHYERNDWHFAYAATLSRESPNPRPEEFRRLHRSTRGYVVGSVSYSEGVNDDFNKMLWSDMDFYGEIDPLETAEDYARLFFPGADPALIADAIFGLELNWQGDPALNASVEPTLEKWLKAGADVPALYENWRYVMHLFRAKADAFVRRKRRFELSLIRRAGQALCRSANGYERAREILRTPIPDDCTTLREQLDQHAAALFTQIGMQLDVARYHADNWDRGAVLDTIDRPVTDRAYLLSRFDLFASLPPSERLDAIRPCFTHTDPGADAYYYSVALHGLDGADVRQDGEVYLNFIGDNPTYNDGTLPMSCTAVYDNEALRCKVSGLTGSEEYRLRVVYLSKKEETTVPHVVKLNGATIYEGAQFGEPDPDYDQKYLPSFLESAVYTLPSALLENGCGILEISQGSMGVRICELSITKKG